MKLGMTLSQCLHEAVNDQSCAADVARLLEHLSVSGQSIANTIQRGALTDSLGLAGTEQNVQGEDQKALDVIANDCLIRDQSWHGLVAAIASEEMALPSRIAAPHQQGDYLLLFDPLDGSSNLDVNLSVGTIFSILPCADRSKAHEPEAFYQAGRHQVAAGYMLYGPQTSLVLTWGSGVHAFSLDHNIGQFILISKAMRIPEETQEFAINMSNHRHWQAPVQRYVDELLAGETGPLAKNYNLRWLASMVAEIHRILTRGGIFMYPYDLRDPSKAGRLRLMYEANPLALLVAQAGGLSTNGYEDMLSILPHELHQRVPVFMGSKAEVERITSYHRTTQL